MFIDYKDFWEKNAHLAFSASIFYIRPHSEASVRLIENWLSDFFSFNGLTQPRTSLVQTRTAMTSSRLASGTAYGQCGAPVHDDVTLVVI